MGNCYKQNVSNSAIDRNVFSSTIFNLALDICICNIHYNVVEESL